MQQRLTDLVSKDSIVNNLTTNSRTSGLALDARQGGVLSSQITGLDATKATITILTNPFTQFTAIQNQYFVFGDILYKRIGATVNATPADILSDNGTGWQYVLGYKFYDGFTVYPTDPHTINNDSRWIKYKKGVSGQQAINGQIWYTNGRAYRNINTVVANGNSLTITGDNEFANDTSRWEPILGTVFTPASIKSTLSNSTAWSNGEYTDTTPAGSVAEMKFSDAKYFYQYTLGMADTTGSTYVWIRLLKSI